MGQVVETDVKELAGKVMAVIEQHVRVPESARSRRAWQMQHCSCGWDGYPHSDHQQLKVYVMMLRDQLGIVPAAVGVGE